jgi:sugar-specific transcriptional regulator TrmB
MELLTDKENRVLETLYKLGQSPVQAIATDTLINRTALYHTLESLIKKGVVTKVEKDKVSYFEAITLEHYEIWAKSKIDRLKEQSATDIQKFSTIKSNKKMSLFADVKYFEGIEGVKSLYFDTIYNNKEKMLYSITDYDAGYATLDGKWLEEEYLAQRVKKGIRVRNIVPDTPEKLLRDICFVNFFNNLGIEINMYDDKMALVAFNETHPLGIIVKNEIIAKAFKEILRYIWETGDIVGKKT